MCLVRAKFHSLLVFILHRQKPKLKMKERKANEEEGQKMPFSLDKSATPERFLKRIKFKGEAYCTRVQSDELPLKISFAWRSKQVAQNMRGREDVETAIENHI